MSDIDIIKRGILDQDTQTVADALVALDRMRNNILEEAATIKIPFPKWCTGPHVQEYIDWTIADYRKAIRELKDDRLL